MAEFVDKDEEKECINGTCRRMLSNSDTKISTACTLTETTCTPKPKRLNYMLYHVSRIVTLSGALNIYNTLVGTIRVCWSFNQGVIDSYKGVNSCFNPQLLYLPPILPVGQKAHFLSTRISPHLQGLSMDNVSIKELLTIHQLFKHLKILHMYRIFNVENNVGIKSDSKQDITNVNSESKTSVHATKINEKAEEERDSLCLLLNDLIQLEKLTLCQFYLSPALPNSLAKLTNLRILKLNSIELPLPLSQDSEKSEIFQKFKENFTENDWIMIANNCSKLERLELDGIKGLTEKSLNALKTGCKQLRYFSLSAFDNSTHVDDDDDDYEYDRQNSLWYKITQVFGQQLKGFSLSSETYYETGLRIPEMVLFCECVNIEELCLDSVLATDINGFGELEHLRKLELRCQNLYNLEEIAFECDKLEEFTYTNKSRGGLSYSHALMPFVDSDSCPNLKKFYTNRDTCSIQMATMIVCEHIKQGLEILCLEDKINIFSHRYQFALENWDQVCPCGGFDDSEGACSEDVCVEKHFYKNNGVFNGVIFDKDGKFQRLEIFIPTSDATDLITRAINVIRKFNNEKFNKRIDLFLAKRKELKDSDTPNYPKELDWLRNVIKDFEHEYEKVIIPNCGNCVVIRNCFGDIVTVDMAIMRKFYPNAGSEKKGKVNSPCKHREWMGEFTRIRKDMNSSFTKLPDYNKAAVKSINALKIMRQFNDAKYNKTIDQLLATANIDWNNDETSCEGECNVDTFDFDAALKIFLSFETYYEIKRDNDQLDHEQDQLFQYFLFESEYAYQFSVDMRHSHLRKNLKAS